MRFVLMWLSMPVLMASCAPKESGPTADPAADEEAAWRLEEAYFRFVQAGDVENFRNLWHDQFVGWPCGSEVPEGKDTVDDWVEQISNENIQVEYSLNREAVRAFGDIVVTHYGVSVEYTYSDGTSEFALDGDKITHTWQRSGDTWKIITGMCGAIS
jgi:ketosteroid isomerase-like protein